QEELSLLERGTVDPPARMLIDRARRTSWQTVTASTPGGPVHVDISAELFRYVRTLPGGPTEQVLCDGPSLHVIYPEVGVGATRAWSRWQRGWIDPLVPWALASPEEMAIGADVVMAAEGVVLV